MGNDISYDVLKTHVEKEFNRLKKNKRNHLTVDEAKQLCSFEDYPINFSKLAILYMLDADKNGKFSIDDLYTFAKFCTKAVKNHHNFKSELSAQCTFYMWKLVSVDEGKSFVQWFGKLCSAGMKVKIPKYPDVVMLNTDVVSTIHELLSIKESYGVTCQMLIVLMQNVGEEMGLMKLDDEELDDVVPLQVIHIFAQEFIDGFLKMMNELGFKKEIYLDKLQ